MKKRNMIPLLTAGLLLLGENVWAQNPPDFWHEDIWLRTDRGFLYYGPENERADQQEKKGLDHLTTLEDLQAEVTARLHRAVMAPSEETLTDYLEANTFLLEKSERFASTWQKTLWAHPEYDHTVKNPGANFAQVLLKENKAKEKTDLLRAIARDWSIVFVVQAGCPFCDAMAAIAAYLKEATPIETLSVFIGSQHPEQWPASRPDNGIVRKLLTLSGIDSPLYATPALFMVHRTGLKARLVATGALSADTLTDRLITLATLKDSE